MVFTWTVSTKSIGTTGQNPWNLSFRWLRPSRSSHPVVGGPKVGEPADKDPREFLVDISAQGFTDPVGLTVRYFACDDAQTFCIPVTQKYILHLERDPDGGTARRGSRMGGDFLDRLWKMDRDGDGRLSAEEVPERMKRRFRFIDANGDGFLEEEELRRMSERIRRRRYAPE